MSVGGGGLSPIGKVVGQLGEQSNNYTGNYTGQTDGVEYTPVQQGPIYRPQYQEDQTPQPMMQQQSPSYQSGLQAAMMQMMQQYNRPMMRAPMQQGLMPYNSPALNYRPNMASAIQGLSRVAPSVQVQQREAAARQAAIDAANASQGGGE
jgi:hypothetical protein